MSRLLNEVPEKRGGLIRMISCQKSSKGMSLTRETLKEHGNSVHGSIDPTIQAGFKIPFFKIQSSRTFGEVESSPRSSLVQRAALCESAEDAKNIPR